MGNKKKLVIFHYGLKISGGSERVTLEEEAYFNSIGVETYILTFYFNENIFNNQYHPNVCLLQSGELSKNVYINIFKKILRLRKEIIRLKPHFIICVGEAGSFYLYFATLFTKHVYSTHIPQTMFWDIQTYKNKWDNYKFLLGRYSFIFKSVYQDIRNATHGHKISLPENRPKLGIKNRLLSEIIGILSYISVRKAKSIFVLSELMGWEVKKMYKKQAIVLRGAFPEKVLHHKPKLNLRHYLGINNKKIIFALSRLEPKKRVDLIIKGFSLLLKERDDIILIIGGDGSSEKDLKRLVKKLKVENFVIFTGFIDDRNLHDYYYYCDLFVSADHADFDITTYMAIGFNKKCVWAIDNELEEKLKDSNMVFLADLSPDDFAKTMNLALNSEIKKIVDISEYSWESYFSNIYKNI
jgi:glycosyltransferase involved in cell wall biosynthesis